MPPLAEVSFDLNTSNWLDASGQRVGLIMLASMLLSFGFIRFSTRMIRAEVSWWPGNIETAGVHVHHLVFGIVLLMVAGFVEFSVQPERPWTEILAAAFGVGLGLTLDEFALWLHLEDVYWAEEGRRSVDAVVFAAIIGALVLVGTVPLGATNSDSGWVLAVTVVANLGLCVVTALKGKYTSAVAGMLMPPVAWVAAVRLARPGSWWAGRRYEEGGPKLAKARVREARHHRRRTWFQNLVGGHPSEPPPGKEAEEPLEHPPPG
jgi:lysyl-tRNA synthetase class 2